MKEGPRHAIREAGEAKPADDGTIVPKLKKKFLANKDTAKTLSRILSAQGHLDLTGFDAVRHASQAAP